MVRSRSLAEVVEHLPSKKEVLSSNHIITTKKNNNFLCFLKTEKTLTSLPILIKGDI
jgi:hypothetical protein